VAIERHGAEWLNSVRATEHKALGPDGQL